MSENEKKSDGGPAFPQPQLATKGGMSLRDYFAGQALHAFCAIKVPSERELEAASRAAYAVADAMLAERERGGRRRAGSD